MTPEQKEKGRAYFEACSEARARENRLRFLDTYKVKYDKLVEQKKAAYQRYIKTNRGSGTKKKTVKEMRKIDKQIADLIADLLKKEPSHLAEPWILWNVVSWMRRYDCSDFLNAAFIEQTGRNRPTAEEKKRSVEDMLLVAEIRKIRGKKFCGIKAACEEFANRQANVDTAKLHLPQWDKKNLDQDLIETLRKKMYREKNAWFREYAEDRELRKEMPFPYYGRDFDYHVDSDTLPPHTPLDPFDLYE